MNGYSIRKSCGAGAVAAAMLLGACSSGPERSVQSFCSEFQDQAKALHSKYQQQARTISSGGDVLSNALGALGAGLGAQGDLVVLFDRLDERAPSKIEPDVAQVRDSFRAQADAMKGALGNPLGALGAGLISGLQAQGSYTNVETYIKDNCDLSFMK